MPRKASYVARCIYFGGWSNGNKTTTAAKAWLAANPNYKEINAKQALADPNSIYGYFKKIIEFRKKTLR